MLLLVADLEFYFCYFCYFFIFFGFRSKKVNELLERLRCSEKEVIEEKEEEKEQGQQETATDFGWEEGQGRTELPAVGERLSGDASTSRKVLDIGYFRGAGWLGGSGLVELVGVAGPPGVLLDAPLAVHDAAQIGGDGRVPGLGALLQADLLAVEQLQVLVDDLVGKVAEQIVLAGNVAREGGHVAVEPEHQPHALWRHRHRELHLDHSAAAALVEIEVQQIDARCEKAKVAHVLLFWWAPRSKTGHFEPHSPCIS